MGSDISTEPAFSLEIDRKQLNDLRRRFLEINEKRKALLAQNISEREEHLIQLLPFLFHINHPTLPGYVGSDAPCGLANYQPDKATIQLAKKYAKSLDYKSRAVLKVNIEAIYLMGSAGSVAHSGHSDLDIWVCVRNQLSEDEWRLLRQKRDKLQRWAREMAIECSIFLVTTNAIVDSSAESEKQTIQSELLLDEFYRTQIYLAGRYLLWWLVPTQLSIPYKEYASKLLDQRFVQPEDWIDFGPVEEISLEEYISNSLWYINKALTSPYKTALKLVLMESYLSQYPDVKPLSDDYKSFVHNLLDNATVIDAYLLMHRKVEEYLILNDQMDRLEFVRRCLYHKIQGRGHTNKLRNSMIRNIVDQLVKEWQWSDGKRQLFDQKSSWDINQIGNEKRLYIKQLITSFRTIGQFIKRHQEYFEKYKSELLCLSHKISAKLEQTQGKIERVNINFVQQMMDKHLSLIRQYKGRELELWSFFDRAISQQEAQSTEPVYQCNSLLELLVWAKVNGLLSEGTSVQFRDAKQQLQYDELEQLIQTLLLNQYDSMEVPDEAFQSPAKVKDISCFINIAQDRLTDIAKQGVHIITHKNDPFCYGDECINLIETVDLYYVNTWGEQFVIHFQGEDCLSEATIALLELIERQSTEPNIQFYSFSSMRAESIVGRVKSFFRQVLQSYQSSNANITKFFFRLGQSYHMIHKQSNRYIVHKAENESQLGQLLINQDFQYQLIESDTRCFSDPIIRTAIQKSTAGERLLLINNAQGHFMSYCFVDQHGGLVYQQFRSTHAQQDLATLYHCLKTSMPKAELPPLQCYVYERDQSLARFSLDTSLPESEIGLSVRYFNENNQKLMTIRYHERKFTFDRDDAELRPKFLAWLDRAFAVDEHGFYIAELELDQADDGLTEAGLLLERNELYTRLTSS